MLGNESAVADHYTVNGLDKMVLDALNISGVNLDTLSPADLAPIDEFHMGGRAATQYVVSQRIAQRMVAGTNRPAAPRHQ